jgi:hypothetical protein
MWTLTSSWFVTVGSLLLAIGTGAQAWADITQYRWVSVEARIEARRLLQRVFPKEVAAMTSALSYDGRFARRMLKFGRSAPMIVLAPFKITAIRKEGGEEALRLARAIRQETTWVILMIGSLLILTAGTIELALAYE